MSQERGRGWLEGVHPDDLDRCLAAHHWALEARGALRADYRLRVGDGQYRRVAPSGLPPSDPQGRFEGYLTVLLDVTERQKAEQTLQRSKALRFAAFQSLPGKVVVIAKDGRVVAMNGARVAGEAPQAADPDAPGLGPTTAARAVRRPLRAIGPRKACCGPYERLTPGSSRSPISDVAYASEQILQ